MNDFKYLLIFLLFTFFNTLAQPKAVFIIVDGIPADVLENTETPVMDAIVKKGAYTRAYLGGEKGNYSESPTVSAVGYNHVLTGVWTNKHNVRDNDIANPNYNYWNLFRIAKAANPKLKTAIFSTWLDNRTKLVGENLPSAGNIKLDYAFDGFENDTIAFPHINQPDGFEWAYFFDIDEHVSKEAARYIRENGPDLSWVYLEHPDDIGHYYGDGPKMTKVVENADVQIGRIWEAIKEREKKFNEQWMILITTDHGRDAKTGKSHGGHSERERTVWIVTNVRETNRHFKEMPATVDIMPSILRFMHIEIPEPILTEVDGVPFIGAVSIANMKAERKGNKIEVTWDALNPSGKVVVQVSTTNNFAKGGKDVYEKVGEADVSAGRYSIDISNMNSSFYKILLKAPGNWTNRWIVSK